MRVQGISYRTIWVEDDGFDVRVIDQTRLPEELSVLRIHDVEQMAHAIRSMQVRGAPLIGVSAAYGLCLAMRSDSSDRALSEAAELLLATRPTAVNLRWAVERMRSVLSAAASGDRAEIAYDLAAAMADEDVRTCESIGVHGARLLRSLFDAKIGKEPLRVLTHCNAGWLATVDWGTALAPIYRLFDEGVPIEVWVDETRPRNQGYLTAWELGQHGVPYTVIADNAGGHYMSRGEVDVCNKIGTYLKALAANDCSVPFFAAVPSSTIDFAIDSGAQIPIEERDPRELCDRPGVRAANPAFDVTPARLVTGIITERGVAESSRAGLEQLFPERR